jgi:hypothetical protein
MMMISYHPSRENRDDEKEKEDVNATPVTVQ